MSSKVNQLQLLQQNLHNFAMQKQQLESQLVELDSALKELKTSSKTYKIIGKIMISASEADLKKDLEEKKDVLKVRLDNIIKQEENLKKTFEKTQKEVMSELKEK